MQGVTSAVLAGNQTTVTPASSNERPVGHLLTADRNMPGPGLHTLLKLQPTNLLQALSPFIFFSWPGVDGQQRYFPDGLSC